MPASKLQTIRLLNGLRLLNDERAAGYATALSLLHNDPQIKERHVNIELLLSWFIKDSHTFSNTLKNIVLIEGGKMPYGSKIDQQLYQSARQLKLLFTGIGRQILDVCRQCEQAMQLAYDAVLNETGLAPDPKNIIETQQLELKRTQLSVHTLIKELEASPGRNGNDVLI
ncbi:MAG: hypothetical protein QM687_11820 [Ferruginibacter sp.]